MSGVQSTAGHLASQMGLRGHSVGIFFPVVLGFIGTPDNLRNLVVTPTGEAIVDGHRMAAALAEAWKERRRWRDDLPVDVVYEWAGCGYADASECETLSDVPLKEAVFFGIYTRDADGLAVWLTDVNTVEQAEIIISKLKELPL